MNSQPYSSLVRYKQWADRGLHAVVARDIARNIARIPEADAGILLRILDHIHVVDRVCLHGTYHRGNAGLLLQKNGVAPNDDRMTDFLEAGA